jgi:cell division protease FtsH
MTLGGRIAEDLAFGEITTGAKGDLEQATKSARDLVTRFGMSEKLGPMVYGQKDELVFLGREIGEQRDYSDAVAEEIDNEVRRLVSDAYERARKVLVDHRDKLDLVAETLMEVETLDREAFVTLMDGDQLEEQKPTSSSRSKKTTKKTKKSSEEESEDSSPNLDFPPAPAPA